MDTDKMEIEKFIRQGKELGLEGAELREWVEEQQEYAKEEREWAREDKERERIAAKEAEELQLKLQELRMKLRNSVHETTLDFEATDKSAHAFHVKETVPYKCEDWGQMVVSSKTEDVDNGETASKDCDPVVEERKDISGQDEVESISDGSERAVLNAAQYSKEAVESVDAFELQDTVVEHTFEELGQEANSSNEEGDSEEPAVAPKKVGAKENESDESLREKKAGLVTNGSDSNGHLDEPGQCHVDEGPSVKENEQCVTSCEMAAESSKTCEDANCSAVKNVKNECRVHEDAGPSVEEKEQKVTSYEMESEGWLSCEQAEFSEVENAGSDAATCLEVGGIHQCMTVEDDVGRPCTNRFSEERRLLFMCRHSSEHEASRRLATISVGEGQERQWMLRQSLVGRRTDKCTKERSFSPRRARDRPCAEKGMRGCFMTWADRAHLFGRARCGPWRWRKKSGVRPHRVRFKSRSN
ncbi:hypothetical protein HPB50_002745 [Hyalomma asiaticum]|uniref:Uncharacterized protein n=1 Tax=Hyalomma asiaticum TaxID=266040 RepID=A0ACB7TDY9_HYAAI|nr:hypothetical protein HPB50_002745 [Hyalomma asiaticum]